MLGVKAAVTHPYADFGSDRGTRLALTRRYNSSSIHFSNGGAGAILGMGWHHDFEASLQCTGDVCVVLRGLFPGYRFRLDGAYPSPDGTESWDVYRASAPAGYTPPHRNVLVRRPDGEWIVFGTDGTALHFATVCTSCDTGGAYCRPPELGGTARLVRVVDARGVSTRLSYDAPRGVLLALTDDLGHSLELRNAGVCPAHAAELRYDGAVVARYAIGGGVLDGVTDADGSVLRTYVNTSFAGGVPRLQAILNEAGTPIAEFSYDAELRAIGAVAADSSVQVRYGADGSSAVVTEYFHGPYGDTSETGERQLDWERRVIAVTTGNAVPAKAQVWTPGGKLACSVDAAGHATVREYDALGRATHVVQLESPSCTVPSPLPQDAREEWRAYGLRRAIAQGLDLELDEATAISRQSGVSPGNLVGETYDFNPAPESIDPADYTCQGAPLPSGSVVCRQIRTGYVSGASGPVLERHATFYSYDARGRLVRTYGPVDLDRPGAADVPPLEERTYWGDGESSARQGRLHEVKRYPAPTSAPLVTAYDYDTFGVYRVVAPDGSSTTIIKDGRGRPTFVAQADAGGVVRARTETRFYDGQLPRLRILPSGAAERYSYDNRGRLQQTEYLSGDPDVPGATPTLGWSEWFAYDEAGNRITAERRDHDGRVTWQQARAFDVQHRVVRESNPALPGTGKSWAYDSSGFLTALTDEEGRGTRFTPDPLNRVQKVTRTGLDALGSPAGADVAVYQYGSGQDTLASVTDGAGRPTGYSYDDFGRVQKVTSGSLGRAGGVWYRYDPRGNPVARGDQTVNVAYGYDGLDRLLTENAQNSADGSSIVYQLRYDEGPYVGRLTTIVEPERTVTFTYDWAGRLASEEISVSGVAAPLTTSYAYDLDGVPSQVTYPSGLAVQLEPDPATRQVAAVREGSSGATWASGITRHPGGPIASLTYGNGRTLTQTFNSRYEPLTIESGPVSLTYGMSPAGDVGVVTDQSEDPTGCVRGVTRSASYDYQDRLASWSDAVQTGTGVCAPDTLGSAPASFSYVAGTDQVASQLAANGTTPMLSFGYDLQGNVSAVGQYDAGGESIAGAMCLRHDALGRLVLAGTTAAALAPGATACTTDADVTAAVARFKYDVRNRRVARLRDGVWTYVVPDASGSPLSELALVNGAWTRTRDYVWLDGLLVAQVEYAGGAAHPYYAHLDHLGMPRALTNELGQVVWSVFQRPYGEVLEKTVVDPVSAQTVVTNLRLPGQYDERLFQAAGISGMQGPYYNWNRWYLPSVGRYLELDPLAMKGEFNADYNVDWYNYALGNPLRWTDSDGLSQDSLYANLCPPGSDVSFDANFRPVCTPVWSPPRPPPELPEHVCLWRCSRMLSPWPLLFGRAAGVAVGRVTTSWSIGTKIGCALYCSQQHNYCPNGW